MSAALMKFNDVRAVKCVSACCVNYRRRLWCAWVEVEVVMEVVMEEVEVVEVEGVSGAVCHCDVLLGAIQNAAEEQEAH